MRPRRTVVGPVLTAALALVALPGLAGSSVPQDVEPAPVGAFQPLTVSASQPTAPRLIALDGGYVSNGVLHDGSTLLEPADLPEADPPTRADVRQPVPDDTGERKPPKATLTGLATFYDHGSTAMRLPRGTVVVICGPGGCIERVVTDYGPQAPERIVDLHRPDFFEICGCPSWSGVVEVTVHVY